jgi:tetratricopeptide (TPR) repeat protein
MQAIIRGEHVMSNRTLILAFALCLAATIGCTLTGPTTREPVGDPTEHYVRGKLLAEDGNLDAALDELQRALQADPNLSVAHNAVGSIYLQRGQYEHARQSYQKATQINPLAYKPAYNLGVTYQALANAAQNVTRAQQYLRRAVQTYLRAITLKSDDYDSHLNLSACYYSLGSTKLAEHYCRTAIRIDASRREAYDNLATILESQDKPFEAIQAYLRALEFDTDRPDMLMRLGRLYMQQGRTGSALEVLRRAAELAPESAAAQVLIGQAHYNRQEFGEAAEAFARATQVNPGSASAWRGLGISRMQRFLASPEKTSLRDQALAAWNRSLELNPNQPGLRKLVRKYTPRANLPQL